MKNKIKSLYLNNKKSVIVCAVLLALSIAAVVTLNVINDSNNTKQKKNEPKQVANTNADIIKDSEYNGIKFNNTMLIIKKNESTLTMDATNTNSEVSTTEQVNINLLDKNGNIMATLLGYIGENLKPGEVRTITASVSVSLKDAVKKEIVDFKK